ncbi:hypothetical protein N4R57_11320 [Rhodobacteraceae bacterium D3-12]|nr:hypothetical protein N4R57_11320 [Rhodobacteraceae bacterium D3-12]
MRFANPDYLIMPGQVLRVDVGLGTKEGVLVPQGATSRAADGSLTAFVVKDGKADKRVLTEVGVHLNSWIVSKGLSQGDALVIDGLSNLRDGAEVATTPVTLLNADGVVIDLSPTATSATEEQ